MKPPWYEKVKKFFLPERISSQALLRVDMNISLKEDNEYEKSFKIRTYARRLDKYYDIGIKKFVILDHQGRKGNDDFVGNIYFKSEALNKLTKKVKVKYVDQIIGKKVKDEIKKLDEGEALLLRNVRDLDDEKSELPIKERVKLPLVEFFVRNFEGFYVNDAPALLHRKDTSVTTFPLCFHSYLGNQMKEEIKLLDELYQSLSIGEKISLILGGKKFEKQKDVEKILQHKNCEVFFGGKIAEFILLAKYGSKIFSKKMLRELEGNKGLGIAKELVKKFGDRIYHPIDFVTEDGRVIEIGELKNQEKKIMDVGPSTIEFFSSKIKDSDKKILNGTLGVVEKGFDNTLRFVKGNSDKLYILGGNTSDAISLYLEEKIKKNGGILTGGGSSLHFLAGERLYPLEVFLTK